MILVSTFQKAHDAENETDRPPMSLPFMPSIGFQIITECVHLRIFHSFKAQASIRQCHDDSFGRNSNSRL
jgi:hypothetical protein